MRVWWYNLRFRFAKWLLGKRLLHACDIDDCDMHSDEALDEVTG